MKAVRIISYNLRGCRDINPVIEVIRHWQPNCVLLQNVAQERWPQLCARELGGFKCVSAASVAILSNMELKAALAYRLQGGGTCQRVDIYSGEKRFYLINVALRGPFYRRPVQVRELIGDDILGEYPSAPPAVVAGDFYDILGISCHYNFNRKLQRYAPMFWRATYPAWLPLFSRDRIYATSSVAALATYIDYRRSTRKLGAHVPIIADIKVIDNRQTVINRGIKGGKLASTAAG